MIAKLALAHNAILLAASLVCAAQAQSAWPDTVNKVRSSIVTIRVDQARAFDDEWNKSSEATGFVVDAEQGILLTNRHVVTPGPVSARAEFANGEEVNLTALYRDPVHDFGFFRYDPAELRFVQPVALDLMADKARVGMDIRVLGNDAGERFSVLAGTISKLDRNAPQYKSIGYNDFNTFYIQAATGTSGGSSGSPVIDIEGHVVALNAGAGNQAQSSFFLPLAPVVHALDYVRKEQEVPRGTLQTTLYQLPFSELIRLGLTREEEERARALDGDASGMLAVARILPGSAASSSLQVGDILLAVDDEPVIDFARLEQILDGRVGGMVNLRLQRGGETYSSEVPVADLHEVTPDALLEFGNAVLHTLSYQIARTINRAPQGIFVAASGFTFDRAGIVRGSVITELDGHKVDTLDALVDVLRTLPDARDVPVRFFPIDNPAMEQLTALRLDRRWLPVRLCARPAVGDWECEAEPPPPSSTIADAVSVDFPEYTDSRLNRLSPNLVNIVFEPPVGVAGRDESLRRGTGYVVDWERGLVLAERALIPHEVGRASVIFGGLAEVAANTVYIHPEHAVALLQFDPGSASFNRKPELRWRRDPPQLGESIWAIDRDPQYRPTIARGEVGAQVSLVEAPSGSLAFTESNLEVSSLGSIEGNQGVVLDRKGKALGVLVQRGDVKFVLPSWLIEETIDLYVSERPVYSLETQWSQLSIASARKLGLPDSWVERTARKGGTQVLRMLRTMPGGVLDGKVLPGDLLLEIDGTPVTSFKDVEAQLGKESITLKLWRSEAALELSVVPASLDGFRVGRYLTWGGALFHAPHRAAVFAGVPDSAPYVPFFYFGSPASRAGLRPLNSVIAVDGKPINSIDDLRAALEGREQGAWVRMTLRGWKGDERVVALQSDGKYWPGLDISIPPEAANHEVTSAQF